jgi:hypothetical protein
MLELNFSPTSLLIQWDFINYSPFPEVYRSLDHRQILFLVQSDASILSSLQPAIWPYRESLKSSLERRKMYL